MPKALFYIEGKNVQHIGCRLIVTKQLIHTGLTKGGAFNLPDGRVEIVLEGSEDQLKNAHNYIKDNLIEWIKQSANEREELKRLIGNPKPDVKISELEFNDSLLVLDIGLFSHSLTFDQIYKGIDVYKDLTKSILLLNQTLKNKNSAGN